MNRITQAEYATWKAAHGKDGAPKADAGGLLILKPYVAQIRAEGDCPGGADCSHDGSHAEPTASRDVTFTITTAARDRESDTLAADGWKVDNYLKNPVVLWAHDYRSLPIGRSKSLSRTEGGLSSVAEFASRDLNPLGDTVLRMIRAKYLNATSVGFNPMKWAWNETAGGVDFVEHELLEYSVVPVPANPEALVEARAKGIDTEPVRVWAERVLDEWGDGKGGLWLPKAKVEAVLPFLGKATSYSLPAFAVKAADLAAGVTLSAANPFGGTTTITLKSGVAKTGDTNCQFATECPATPTMPIEDCPGVNGACPIRGENQMDKPKGGVPFFTIVEPDEVTQAELLAEVVREVLTEVVTNETRAAVTALTGRID